METDTLKTLISKAVNEAIEIYYGDNDWKDEEEREWFYFEIIDRLQTAYDRIPF